MSVGERIDALMKKQGVSQNRLAKAAQMSQSGLSSIINGAVSPKESTLQAIANALGCTVSELMGDSSTIPVRRNAVPIVGEIACGLPITAEQNIDGYADLPDGVRADFALRCKGDSMEPTFKDGDLVLIRQQEEADNGQIAAVGVDGEATLKHIYRQAGGLLCVSDNPRYAPQFYGKDEHLTVYGIAVGFVRMF